MRAGMESMSWRNETVDRSLTSSPNTAFHIGRPKFSKFSKYRSDTSNSPAHSDSKKGMILVVL